LFCIAEVCKVIQRDKGTEAAMETMAAMLRWKVIDRDADLAFRAAGIALSTASPPPTASSWPRP